MNAITPQPSVDKVESLTEQEMDDLCAATAEAIEFGNGFGWLKVPQHHGLERFWRGVLLVPERELYIARLDGHVVGSCQLMRPPPNNEAQRHAAILTTFFIAPWARGHGMARELLAKVEASARAQGYLQIDLDVRETQAAAIELFEHAGFVRWAIKPRYAVVDGRFIAGYFYTKELQAAPTPQASAPERAGVQA